MSVFLCVSVQGDNLLALASELIIQTQTPFFLHIIPTPWYFFDADLFQQIMMQDGVCGIIYNMHICICIL